VSSPGSGLFSLLVYLACVLDSGAEPSLFYSACTYPPTTLVWTVYTACRFGFRGTISAFCVVFVIRPFLCLCFNFLRYGFLIVFPGVTIPHHSQRMPCDANSPFFLVTRSRFNFCGFLSFFSREPSPIRFIFPVGLFLWWALFQTGPIFCLLFVRVRIDFVITSLP